MIIDKRIILKDSSYGLNADLFLLCEPRKNVPPVFLAIKSAVKRQPRPLVVYEKLRVLIHNKVSCAYIHLLSSVIPKHKRHSFKQVWNVPIFSLSSFFFYIFIQSFKHETRLRESTRYNFWKKKRILMCCVQKERSLVSKV